MHLGASTTDCMECSKSLNGSIIGRPPLRGRGTGVSIAFSRRCGGGRGVGNRGEYSACPPSKPYFYVCGYERQMNGSIQHFFPPQKTFRFTPGAPLRPVVVGRTRV